MARPDTNPAGKAFGIQALRGLAAILVVFDHYSLHYIDAGYLDKVWTPLAESCGAIGVKVFFAISGYVMIITNWRKFGSAGSAEDFLIRRIMRIWPIYAIATLLFFASHFNQPPIYTFANLAKSLTFIPYIGEGGQFRPVLGKGWTLNYEMFFYTLFTFSMLFNRKNGITLIILALMVFGISGYFIKEGTVLGFYFNNLVLYFLIGMIAAIVHILYPVHFRNAEIATAIAAGITIFLSVRYDLFHRSLVSDIARYALVFCAIFLVCDPNTKFTSKFLEKISSIAGDSSYALYLFHGFSFVFFIPILKYLHGSYVFVIYYIAVMFALIICYFIHTILELRIQSVLHRLYKSYKGRSA